MPIISINLSSGRGIDAKRRFARMSTEAACDCFGVAPETVRVIFDETTLEDFAVAGILLCDREAGNVAGGDGGERIAARLQALGISLPTPPSPAGNYVPISRAGDMVFTSGQLPREDGELAYRGKLGLEVAPEDGYAAARLCSLNCLGLLDRFAGGVANVRKIVKVSCFVNAAETFRDFSKVADGATDLLGAIFGANGVPARSAVGMASLPQGASVEVEMAVQVWNPHLCQSD